MTGTSKRQVAEEWDEHYRISDHPVVLEIERLVHGTDYGINSFTTRQQADDLIEKLDLGSGKRLLDLGSGAGWPGLYLADGSGCDVVLFDLPATGMDRARRRARRDDIADRVDLVVGSGSELPFHSNTFDAVTHADVLC